MSSIILKQHYQKLRESIIEDIRRVVKEHQEVEIEVEPVKKMMIKRLLVESVTGMGAILGDGEADYTGETCEDATYMSADDWETAFGTMLPEGDLIYPGYTRKICARITNEAEIALPYTMTGTTSGNDCLLAFPGPYTDTGIAEPGITYAGVEIVIATDVPLPTGCTAIFEVGRGTA